MAVNATHGELRENRHHDQWPVGMLRAQSVEIDFAYIAGHAAGKRDARGREAIVGGGHAGRIGARSIFLAPLRNTHGFNANGVFRAGGNTCRILPLGQPSIAHVAFAHDAALRVVLRHAIGAIPGAVLAANADIGAVTHDSSGAIFGVGIDRAPRHAGGFKAVVTAHRQIVAERIWINAALNLAHPPPENIRGIAILLVAGHHAALAPDALGHVEVKAVLLIRPRWRGQCDVGTYPTQRSHHIVGWIHRGGEEEGVVACLGSFE